MPRNVVEWWLSEREVPADRKATMILIFRKAAEVEYGGKVKKALADEVTADLAEAVRVQRPEVVEFFLPTGRRQSLFAKLPEATEGERANVSAWGAGHKSADAKAAKATIKAKAFKVPTGSLGRGGTATPSQAQSILLWIKTRLAPAAAEHGVTVAAEDGTDLSVLFIDR